jgi:hypothetical protein
VLVTAASKDFPRLVVAQVRADVSHVLDRPDDGHLAMLLQQLMDVDRRVIGLSEFTRFSHVEDSFWLRAGLATRPVDDGELLLFVRRDAERDASIERRGFNLDVEPVAVLVRPCRPNSCEDGLLPFAVTNGVGDVARKF